MRRFGCSWRRKIERVSRLFLLHGTAGLHLETSTDDESEDETAGLHPETSTDNESEDETAGIHLETFTDNESEDENEVVGLDIFETFSKQGYLECQNEATKVQNPSNLIRDSSGDFHRR